MQIIQWNITSMNTNFSELKVLIKETNPTCLCLQETRHGSKILTPPSNYNIVQSKKKRDDDHERGTVILVRKDTNYEEITLNSPLQVAAVKIWLGRWYTVCSLYLPHIPVERAEILSLIEQLPKPFLLLGDMNARHHLWGEPVDNEKGKLFERLLLEEDISLLNSESPTHYHQQTNTFTTIDLSICSSDCYPDFTHQVTDSLRGSDHYPILLDKIQTPEAEEPNLRFKTERADWKKFKLLTNNYIPPESTENIDETIEHLNSFIMQAATESIPLSKGKRNKIPIPWWNDTCKKVHTERKRAERAFKRNRSTSNLIAFKRTQAVCRRTFKEARKSAWRKYISTININTNMSQIWKKIQKMRGKYSKQPPPLLKTRDDTLTQDPNETSNIFAEAFASVSDTSNYSPTFQRHKLQSEKIALKIEDTSTVPKSYNLPFTIEEFHEALSSTKETSPGLDKITFSMIKNLHSSLQSYILEVYNRIYLSSLFPTLWKVAIILPIPKANKDNKIPLNYRPISLTSCLCKLLEKMVNLRLMWYLEKEDYLSPFQSGFRRNRSTIDSLVQFENDIRSAISRNEHSIAIFFDLTKAYDMVWKYDVIKKLSFAGLRGNLLKFVRNFLTGRKIMTRIGGTYSDPVSISEGVPQGSVLSCTLFAVAINDALDGLPSGVRASLYVDDLTIYMSGRSNNLIERHLQLAINELEKWCNRTGFIFSEAKTVAMHLCRKRRCPKTAHQLTLNQSPISVKEHHTYLGLAIDNSLTWKEHIKQLKRNCYHRLNLIKHLSHVHWGADSTILKRIYQAIVLPKLDYGSEAYGSASPTNMKLLDPIQNQAIRLATGAFRTCPVKSLEVLSGFKPLHIHRESRLIHYFLRIITNAKNPMYNKIYSCPLFSEDEDPQTLDDGLCDRSFLKRTKSALEKYSLDTQHLILEPTPTTPPWELNRAAVCVGVADHCKKETPAPLMKAIFMDHLENEHQNQLNVFTDGSKDENGVGFAVVSERATISGKLQDLATVFSAELTAILEAINHVHDSEYAQANIITDSRSSIQAIMNIQPRNPIVQNIHDAIKSSQKSFNLCWVPSHVGVDGNEQADRLARASTSSEAISHWTVSRGDLRTAVKATAKRQWKESWRSLQDNKLREITDSISTLPNSSCPNRMWERALVRLRSGHSRLTHGHIMTRDQPPTCQDCEDSPLTIKHLLVECPLHRSKRLIHFGSTNVTLSQILKDRDTSFGGPLFRYLDEVNILHQL